MTVKPSKSNQLVPLLMALCGIISIGVGSFYSNYLSGNQLNIINTGADRINNLLHIVDDQYVDRVNLDPLVEDAMPKILTGLDPHSAYISAKDVQAANQELQRSFSGAGIEFTIHEDTIHVQNVIQNGPAEHAGILADDRIVAVDGKPFVGKVVTNQETMKRLKGPEDMKVKIGVVRYGDKRTQSFVATRGDIPLKSVSATYMIDNTTGYIRIRSFDETTYAELLVALVELGEQGFKNLIIGLRDNTSGYLQSAVQMANEFLPKSRLIVYTEGCKSPGQEFRSDGQGNYKQMPLVVLINKESASASEIFAGAMWDNDRATIIGRYSSGRGLVQKQIEFSNRSMVRLTIACYYTPSGRCIRRPYVPENEQDYAQDLLSRYQHGEFFSEGSIEHAGPAYHAANGRSVYGEDGITPDLFVPEDTTTCASYYKQASMSGLVLQFAFSYTDGNRLKLNNFKEIVKMENYLKKQDLVDEFATYADKKGLKRHSLMIRKPYNLLDRYINSRVIYNMLNKQAWLQYINQDDASIQETLKTLRNSVASPKVPEQQKNGKKENRRVANANLSQR